MPENSNLFEGRRLWLLSLLSVFSLSVAQVIPGEPPAFPSTDDPRDQFVFERDADGNPVSLIFICPVTGSGPPVIDWYRREVGGDFIVDNMYRTADNSYVFPNITETDSAYASGDGIEYYCTATNDFGTIRSRTVRAFYADFKGFAVDGVMVAEGIEPEIRPVDVIQVAGDNLQWVALQCEIVEGSTPTPAIQWRRRPFGSDPEMVPGDILAEDFTSNTIRFVDGGEWLILETDESAITGREYFCEVTNKRRFQMVRGPLTYTLNPVNGFPDEPDGIKVYKSLTSRSVPRVEFMSNVPTDSDMRVVFGTAIARNGSQNLNLDWRLNGRPGGRLAAEATTAAVLPSFTDTDTRSVLTVRLSVSPTPDEQETELVATLTLLEPAVINEPRPVSVQDRLSGTSQSFTCHTGGSDPKIITFFHNGVILEDGNGVNIEGGTLTITSTSTGSSGMYQCLVENDSGSDVASWYLIVRDAIAPTITTSFAVAPDPCLGFSFIQKDDPPVTLTVNVSTDPCSTPEWTRDGGGLPASGVTEINGCGTFQLGDKFAVFSLTITEFTLDTLGEYAVTFTNVAGSASVPATRVTDRVRADITGIRVIPDNPIEGMNANCLSESGIEIFCDNMAFPVATVEFLKDGIPVTPGGRITQDCGVLTITAATEEDEGTYSCRVQNDDTPQYEDISGDVELEFCITPTITGGLTFTKNNPDEGAETVGSCSWTGSPDPVITWYKDGSPLIEGELPKRIRITMTTEDGTHQSSLEIDEVELSDTGDYTCNVSNPVGFVFRRNRLEVQDINEPLLGEIVIIGIAAGGAAALVLVAVVVVLLCCVWHCARKSQSGVYMPTTKDDVPMAVMGGPPESYNVDAPDGLDDEPEAFNPDYASLPAMRPAQPPQYKPTPNYPADMPPPEEYQKRIPSEEDFVGPYGHDNGGMHHHQPYQPTVDDFVSDDAQFV